MVNVGSVGNMTNNYENLRKFINFMNMSEEELYALIKHHFPNNSIRHFYPPEREEICMEDPDKYCDGSLRTLAVAYKNIHGYVSLAVCLFGTIANLLNAAVLTRKEMSSAPINRILTGLAVADMLVMLEYVPFSCYMYLIFPDTRNFPYSWAVFILFHVHFSQILHTISICLTLTLAIWRYIAIRHPQRSIIWCTEPRCHLAIATSYILPLFLCIPSYLVFHIRATTIKENATEIVLYHLDLSDIAKENDRLLCNITFWTYGVVIKLLPCVILTVISCRLIQALYKVNKRKQALKGYNSCNNSEQAPERRLTKAERKTDRTTRMLVAILLLFLITEFPQGIFGLLSGILGTCFFRNCYNLFGEMMDILALINGAINFILYCFMSRQFRLTFEKLFKPKVLTKWAPRTSQTDLQSTDPQERITYHVPELPRTFTSVSPPIKEGYEKGNRNFFLDYRKTVLSKYMAPMYKWGEKYELYTPHPLLVTSHRKQRWEEMFSKPNVKLTFKDEEKMKEIDDFYLLCQFERQYYNDYTGHLHPMDYFERDLYKWAPPPDFNPTYVQFPEMYVKYRQPVVFPLTTKRAWLEPSEPCRRLAGKYDPYPDLKFPR